MAETRTAGTIYDLGYQRYTGGRYGRSYAFWTLFLFSVRAAFGLGRGDRSKMMPIIALTCVYMPAAIQIGVASVNGMTEFITYADHLEFTAFFLALFAASQAPELVVTDKQYGVLSLYLSRPLKSFDYAFAKLAALTAAMIVLTLGPQLLLFTGKIFIAAAPWAAFKAEYAKLLPMLGGTLLTSVFVASIGLAISSLAGRRGYATAGVIAFFLLTAAASTMFRAVATGDVKRYAILANPALLMRGFAGWLFDIEAKRRSAIGRAELPGHDYFYVILIVTAVMVVVLVNRYRKAEA